MYVYNPFIFSLTYFIGICLVHFGRSISCPYQCNCKSLDTIPHTWAVVCSFYKFESKYYPLLLPENTTHLYIKCFEMGPAIFLEDKSPFNNLTSLRKLIFETCYFKNLPENIFLGLHNLRNLTIYNSQLGNIHTNAFNNLHNLKFLKINKCKSISLPVNSLCQHHKLETLDLAENNIRNVSEILNLCLKNPMLFNNITHIYINHNSFTNIPDRFSNIFKSVQFLSLKNNRIKNIYGNAFSNFKKLEHIDFSNNFITKLPPKSFDFSYKLFYLDISNNPIKELPNTLHNLSQIAIFKSKNTFFGDRLWNFLDNKPLQFLELSNCNLTYIPKFISKLENLMLLKLNKNKIATILPNSFSHCKSLFILDLSENIIPSLPEFTFKGLYSLNSLLLQYNQITTIKENAFLSLTKLSQLNLSANSLNNMPKFPASLVSLDLRKNNIKKISSVLNDTNNHLKYLILADNAIETIENDAFSQLQYLRLLNLKNNNISDINDFHFKSLYMLYGLNIAFNNIKYLSPNTISHLQQLQILYCQHNQLTMLNREMFPKGLAHIDLSHNHITTLSNNLIYDMDNLIELNLRSNNLSHLSSSSFRRSINGKPARILLGGNKLKCDCHLSWLKKVILHNQKYAFHGNIFSDFMFCYQDNPRLPARSMDTMNIDDFLCEYNSRNHIKYYCPYDCHCCSKNLQTCPCFNICPNNCLCLLSLDKNIHKIDCRNSNLTHLERIPPGSFIDLSGNNLNYFDSTNFTNHNTTESLYMNNSQILIIANNTFYTFTKLKRLYLQNNLIEALEEDSFAGLENLQELFLYNNKIQYIPSNTFSKTPKLQYLDLHKNKLKRITSELFSNKALKKINLNHNPWSCKCDDVILFEDIVIKDNELLVDGDNISCDYNISLSISVLDYAKTFCQNTTYNFTTKAILHKDKVLISTISSLSVILLIVFIFTIISYIYRKEIQLYLFVHFGYRLMTEKLKIDEENKLYDAFISFDNSMDKFVIDELLPQLEQNDPPFKLCVHFRDFEVGLQITENIITCIENSKRTVLLLTDNFLKSDWCKYEFQTAHYQGLSKKMKTLIVVFFEDINEDLLDPDLKLYLKTNTYLKYDDPWFWDKLRFALPQKNNSNTTKC